MSSGGGRLLKEICFKSFWSLRRTVVTSYYTLRYSSSISIFVFTSSGCYFIVNFENKVYIIPKLSYFFSLSGTKVMALHTEVWVGGGFSKVVATFNHMGGSFNLFMATTGSVWIIPSFQIWDYVLHVEHISCVVTNCGQHQWVIELEQHCLTHWDWDKMAAIFADDIFIYIFVNENFWI